MPIKRFKAMNKNEKTRFLTFEQIHYLGKDIGLTDLFYQLIDNNILITSKFKEEEEIPLARIDNNFEPIKLQLEDFLVEFFSYPGHFMGTPAYEYSDMITHEEFEWLLQNAIDIMDGKKVIATYKENELIDLLRKYKLDPEPTGDNLHNFEAKCPTGRHHNMLVSTLSNEWGCGYCRINGGVRELKEVYEKYTK